MSGLEPKPGDALARGKAPSDMRQRHISHRCIQRDHKSRQNHRCRDQPRIGRQTAISLYYARTALFISVRSIAAPGKLLGKVLP